MEHALLFVWGGVGAAMYGYPLYRVARKTEPVGEAFANLVYVIFVGAVFGGLLPPMLAANDYMAWTVKPVPYPLAVTLGMMANPATPLIIERGKGFLNMFFDLVSGSLFRGEK